ncbi:MAG: creatininase family protein [Alphaproteobacteria bacterium]|nr:creatininase family protein [Alphaproteobacteria bacterium]
MTRAVRFEELNTGDFEAGNFDKVLMPIGSCESHGDHLPFGTDAMVAHDLALAVAERVERTMVLPPTWFGMSLHYRHKPMSVSVTNDTNIRVYREILDSVIHWGFKKILVINGHDGNIPCIDVAAQDIKIKYPQVGIAVLEAWWIMGAALVPKTLWDKYDGYGHGGEMETSLGMAFMRGLANPNRARGMIDRKDPFIREFWNYEELTDHGATGNASLSTRDKGETFRTALIDYVVAFLKRKDAEGWVISRREA